jgi:hypothetical protein
MGLTCHYTTILKRYALWVKTNVFKTEWFEFLREYAEEMLAVNPKHFQELIIDSSHIRNKQGRDCIGWNALDRNRRSTKHSVVCDQNGVVVSSQLYPSNVHDSTTTITAVDEIPAFCIPDKRFNTYVTGDKGYISANVRSKLKQRRCHLVTPNRKNQRNGLVQMCSANVRRLSKRSTVEHVFQQEDNFKRLIDRYDQKCTTFDAFHYLALTIYLQRNLKSLGKKQDLPVVSGDRG